MKFIIMNLKEDQSCGYAAVHPHSVSWVQTESKWDIGLNQVYGVAKRKVIRELRI